MTTLQPYPVAGLPKPVLSYVPIVQRLIGTDQPFQNPGIFLSGPFHWVQHETANTAPGADALFHARWMESGCPNDAGQPTQTSWHFTVDGGVIVQSIDARYVTWQAADGAGPGNMTGVSCEICVNADGDELAARRNAYQLCGEVARQKPIPDANIQDHWFFNAGNSPETRHHCPDHMLTQGVWPQWQAAAIAVKNGGSMSKIVYPRGMDAGIAAAAFGTFTQFRFDENGPLSQMWLASGDYSPLMRYLKAQDSPTIAREYWFFASGKIAFRPNAAAPLEWISGG